MERELSESPPTVLIVDDTPSDRAYVGLVLRRAGYAVVEAGSGPEAFQYLSANEPPNLILLDLAMPGMDGFHFRAEQQQRAALRQIPVVMLTGMVDEDLQLESGGAVGVLAKPVAPDRLLEVVRQHCGDPAS
jgi:CheY-like chemotaxis protein